MPILSSLFGSDSNEQDSSDFFSIIDSALSLDFSNERFSEEIDEDGSSDTNFSSTQLGTDFDLTSVLSSMTDSFSERDSDGGLFG